MDEIKGYTNCPKCDIINNLISNNIKFNLVSEYKQIRIEVYKNNKYYYDIVVNDDNEIFDGYNLDDNYKKASLDDINHTILIANL